MKVAAIKRLLLPPMTGLWLLYGFVIIGVLYYVSYDVFIQEINEPERNEKNTSLPSNNLRVTTVNKNSTKQLDTDIFDYCPYKPPDPWHQSIMEFVDVKYGFKEQCTSNASLDPITRLENGIITLDLGTEGFSCWARCLNYRNDKSYDAGHWLPIEKSVLECDFVETECKSNDTVKSFVHMQISEDELNRKEADVRSQKNPDVHLIVIDSVASTQLIRALPRTVNFLLHGMDAVEFQKLNKVGSNSRPNAFPLLFGITTEPVIRTVMQLKDIKADMTEDQACSTYMDEKSFIPAEYKKAGYFTSDAEDYFASLVNYPNCRGLREKAFNHYYRPFHIRIREDNNLRNIHEEGRCRGSSNNMLDYQSNFFNAYKVKRSYPKFSLTWLVELTHDDTGELYKADYDLYNFFTKNRNSLNNSFIFFLGDHGPRFGKEAMTPYGIKEQNNPFLYIVVPEHLRNSPMYKQLKRNSEELVTHHDLHSTLKDILYFQPASDFTELEFKIFDNNRRGSSLLRRFQEGVPRTCKTLPIPFQYCICQYAIVNVTDYTLKQELGAFAADQLELLLGSAGVSSKCESIKLSWAEAVQFSSSTSARGVLDNMSYFDVTFEVIRPAYGKFQIPIRREHAKLSLAGRFTRLDRYESRGDCMSNDALRPYCTCKNREHSKHEFGVQLFNWY
ncbi:hypothetical protein RB195_013801 [Necator americanus]